MARQAIDYGPPETLRLCIYQAEGVDDKNAEALIKAIQNEMALYGIVIEVAERHSWQRPGFGVNDIIRGLVATTQLQAPCDRIVGFVGRHFGDFAASLLLPEVLGAVETVTHTRGYMVAEIGSINQIFSSPESTAVHETYHLLGCQHDLTLENCYQRIQRIKAEAHKNRAQGNDFFPGVTVDETFLADRSLTDRKLGWR